MMMYPDVKNTNERGMCWQLISNALLNYTKECHEQTRNKIVWIHDEEIISGIPSGFRQIATSYAFRERHMDK